MFRDAKWAKTDPKPTPFFDSPFFVFLELSRRLLGAIRVLRGPSWNSPRPESDHCLLVLSLLLFHFLELCSRPRGAPWGLLGGIWLQNGFPKLPKDVQKLSKIEPKIEPKNVLSLNQFWTHSKMKRWEDPVFKGFSVLGRPWAEDGPRWPNMPPRRPFWGHLGAIWGHFGPS